MDKRYQVFISSTYIDLEEERAGVAQVVLEMQHFPVGMERWPAADEEQFEFIKRVIDESDYYLLIVGQRYGTTADDGVSYTEKEYDYAVGRGLKVIALVQETDSTPKTDVDPMKRERLDAFRRKLKSGRLIKLWKTKEELTIAALQGLHHATKSYPATGWVRADGIASAEALSDIVSLQKENKGLRSRIAETGPLIPDIAGLDEAFCITGSFDEFWGTATQTTWTCKVTWREIFCVMARELERKPGEVSVARQTADVFASLGGAKEPKDDCYPTISGGAFASISRQLRALRLVSVEHLDAGKVWRLTKRGEDLFLASEAIRTEKSPKRNAAAASEGDSKVIHDQLRNQLDP